MFPVEVHREAPAAYQAWAELRATRAAIEPAYITQCPDTGLVTNWRLGCTYPTLLAYCKAIGIKDSPVLPLDGRTGRMITWAEPRKRGDCWRPEKVTQAKIVAAHRRFWSGDLDLSDFADVVYAFLDQRGVSYHSIIGFLTSQDVDDPKYRTSGSLFASGLMARCRAFVSNEQFAVEQIQVREEPEDPTGNDDSMPRNLRKQRTTKTALNAAYVSLLKNGPDAETEFYSSVRNYALGKITGTIFDDPESSKTADDRAQDVTVYVWENLETFKGTPDSFDRWLNRLCYTEGARAVHDAKQRRELMTSLTVQTDADGTIDNPELYGPMQPMKYRRALPEFISGINLRICQYVREGLGYGAISQVLDLTENAVKQRVHAMREKIEADKLKAN